MKHISSDNVLNALREVCDPEIPVLSVVDLGIVRSISAGNDRLEVTITPTYSGCPAIDVIERNIREKLIEKGYRNFELKSVLSPAWTTDWITEEGRQKLKESGIAPPEKASGDKRSLTGQASNIPCPRCNSSDTLMISAFGSTACKALHRCNTCLEPFDYFKCL